MHLLRHFARWFEPFKMGYRFCCSTNTEDILAHNNGEKKTTNISIFNFKKEKKNEPICCFIYYSTNIFRFCRSFIYLFIILIILTQLTNDFLFSSFFLSSFFLMLLEIYLWKKRFGCVAVF